MQRRAKEVRNDEEQRRKAIDQTRQGQSQMPRAFYIWRIILNRPVPEVTDVDETDVVNDSIGEVTREEIKSAFGDVKSGKAPGIDSITADFQRLTLKRQ